MIKIKRLVTAARKIHPPGPRTLPKLFTSNDQIVQILQSPSAVNKDTVESIIVYYLLNKDSAGMTMAMDRIKSNCPQADLITRKGYLWMLECYCATSNFDKIDELLVLLKKLCIPLSGKAAITLTNLYRKSHKPKQAEILFKYCTDNGIMQSVRSYNEMITMFANARMIDKMEEYFAAAKRRKIDAVTLFGMMIGYSNVGDVIKCESYFKQLDLIGYSGPNVYDLMMKCYFRCSLYDQVILMYQEMKDKRIEQTSKIVNCVISSILNLQDAQLMLKWINLNQEHLQLINSSNLNGMIRLFCLKSHAWVEKLIEIGSLKIETLLNVIKEYDMDKTWVDGLVQRMASRVVKSPLTIFKATGSLDAKELILFSNSATHAIECMKILQEHEIETNGAILTLLNFVISLDDPKEFLEFKCHVPCTRETSDLIINFYGSHFMTRELIDYGREMEQNGIINDPLYLTSLLKCYVHENKEDEVTAVWKEFSARGIFPCIDCCTIAMEYFSTTIGGRAKVRAIAQFLERSQVSFNESIYVTLFSCLSELAQLEYWLDYMSRSSFCPSRKLYEQIIFCFIKNFGNPVRATDYLAKMSYHRMAPSLDVFNCILECCGKGHGELMVVLYEEMKRHGMVMREEFFEVMVAAVDCDVQSRYRKEYETMKNM